MRQISVVLLVVMLLAFKNWSYEAHSNFRVVNGWDNDACTPQCTLLVELKKQGAEGQFDIYYHTNAYYLDMMDSLEFRSELHLPREALVDSMILWIDGAPVPAMHISVGQANATYNSIVRVRRDPAILTKEASSYYNNINIYTLKVFPAFKNQTRHVRIYMHLQGDLLSGMKKIDLGTPGSTVLLIAPDTAAGKQPELNAGSLVPVMLNNRNLLKAEGLSSVGTVLNLEPQYTPVFPDGAFGVLDTTRSDTSFLGMYVDLQKMFQGGRFADGKRFTLVWVPSSSDTSPLYTYSYYYAYYRYNGSYYDTYSIDHSKGRDEKKAITQYISTLTQSDAFNIIYAGATQRMFEPHMVPAAERFRNKAVKFLDSLPLPATRNSAQSTFSALKSAFGSIASADTPAVVLCMDLEPLPWSSAYSYTDYTSQVNAIVAININKAMFYAYIHSSKYAFYLQLAQALNGKICYWSSSLALSSIMEEVFMPNITAASIRFTGNNVVDGVTYQPYYNNGSKYFNNANYSYTSNNVYRDLTCYGKTLSEALGVEISATVDGTRYVRQFEVRDRAGASEGLAMEKKWAVRMTDYFWSYGSSGRLVNPSSGIGELAGLDRNDATVYAKMVDLSLNAHVLTSATALLALEPGMQLVEDPMTDDGSGGNGGGVLALEDDSLEIKKANLETALSASPNPFNPSTRITLTHASLRGTVALSVYGVDGRLVRTLTSTVQSGRAVFEWNGCDASGRKLASGVYIGRVTALGKAAEVRLFLMK